LKQDARSPAEAIVCVGDSGINGLATVRSLGRRGVRVHVVALQASGQITSLSRYCAGVTRIPDLGALYDALCALRANPERRALLFIDNDRMMKALVAHAAELQRRFQVVEPLANAARFMDKTFQIRAAAAAGIVVPRTWLPVSWEDLARIAAQASGRLLAKPSPARFPGGAPLPFKAIVAPNARELERQLRALVSSPADVLVQEYVEGDDSCHYGSVCYRAASSDACFVLSTRKIRQTSLEAGIMAVGRVVDAPEVRRMTRRLVERIDYHGVIHVEFKRSPRDAKYYFIEWNARLPYFHSIGWKAGFDGAYFAYCDHVAPQGLGSVRLRHDSGHHWINLHEDLRRLARTPRLALRPPTWRPYLQEKEWAVFALDDLRPWLRSLQLLAAWSWGLLERAARRRLRRGFKYLGAYRADPTQTSGPRS
jgi:D-aspartate ligase